MKTRIRQLANGNWIVEVRRFLGWSAVWVDKSMLTRGAASAGIYELPSVVYERKGGRNYPICWHLTQEAAGLTEQTVLAIHGEAKD